MRFYGDHFGMETLATDKDGNYFLHDGYLTLALLKIDMGGEAPAGMNHFGFHVADIAGTCKKLAHEDVEPPQRRTSPRPYAEYRAIDPEGNWFDLSEHGYGVD
ncbi:hypothetical protein SNA_20555 [Streptomyces natalensis ATCC 27448]|uniref:VOC domain-containing protein n=1 Tax=Streptomyces natalensis ATCC 27448 TaxID=1240678 RepID=A0A0D7CLV3_9ACTN|nr:hypothetical protein SNA_20555 [Streptomyces natalensis ATCC 27448]